MLPVTENDCFEQLRHDPNVSARKLRLLAVGCCRRAWHLFTPISRVAIETSERFADGAATQEQLLTVARYSNHQPQVRYPVFSGDTWQTQAGRIAGLASNWPMTIDCVQAIMDQLPHAIRSNHLSWESWFGWNRAARAHARYLQCVFALAPLGQHDRTTPLPVSATCLDIANAVYADRAFDRLPILADALEDAGCTAAAVLDHCRQPGEHVRGCWVVDRVLGKE